jgi:hypothetical protein
MSSRVGQERLSIKKKLSKGVEDPVSNTLFDRSRLEWMVLVSRRRNCCKPGRRRKCRKVGVGPKAPLKQLPFYLLLTYTTSKRVVLGMASANIYTRLFPFNFTVDLNNSWKALFWMKCWSHNVMQRCSRRQVVTSSNQDPQAQVRKCPVCDHYSADTPSPSKPLLPISCA